MMKRSFYLASVAVVALVAGAAAAQAADPAPVAGLGAGDFMVRLRGVAVLPDVDTKSVRLADGTDVKGSVDITNNYIPEVDFSYFVTDNIAFELIAGTTRHGVTDKGSILGDLPLGSVWLLPPTLTVQYHFLPKQAFNPYVGAGVNYTFFWNVTKSAAVDQVKYDNNWGYALQVGADYNISGPWFLNVDLKKIFVSTKAKIDALGTRAYGKVDIDPWLVGVGVGYRF